MKKFNELNLEIEVTKDSDHYDQSICWGKGMQNLETILLQRAFKETPEFWVIFLISL